jgi:hypothetical protein
MSEDLRRRVLELYQEVDRAVADAGPVCVASGRCCRFKEYGHVLFVSNLEADVLLASAPSYEPPVSPDFCPFQKDRLCTAREPRPLGCRVYYCDPTYQETGNQITEAYLRRLKELAQEHGVEWHYAPLHHFLNLEEPDSSRERKRPDDAITRPDDAITRPDDNINRPVA